MTIASTLFFSKPHELGQFARETKDYYVSLGWKPKDCCVGWWNDIAQIADDNGGIEYTFLQNGTISRRSIGSYSKLVEFVCIDVDAAVDRHNSLLRGTF